MSTTLSRLHDRLRGSLWAVPGVCVLLAVALALGLVQLDHALDDDPRFTFGAGSDGAREVLSAITTAMITFTGLVFSITIVVLQLTSSQFSPRVLRTFLRDRQTQYALGVFTATFVYAVLVLRTVRSGDSSEGDDTFVPSIATTFALVLLLVSVGLFVSYIHHIATAVQISTIIGAIGKETRAALDARFPTGREEPVDRSATLPPDEPATIVVPARGSGVVLTVDEDGLVQIARDAGVVLRTGVRLGDFVPGGAPLVEVLGDPADVDVEAVEAKITQGRERTLQQDVAFGFRQLVDVAERALSPSTNDTTTATQVLDELHDLLRRLATRPMRTGLHTDDEGTVRLVVPPERFEDYLTLALQGIDQYGADARPVQERMHQLLADVGLAARPEHRPALERLQAERASRTS